VAVNYPDGRSTVQVVLGQLLRADWTDAGVGAAGFIDVYGNNGAAYVLDFGMH
jgi:hypothetical protein